MDIDLSIPAIYRLWSSPGFDLREEISHRSNKGGYLMTTGRLRRRWGRNLLTVLAIMISFAMLISMSSISLGLHRASEERLSDSPRDVVVSSIGLDPNIEDSHEVAKELKESKDLDKVMPLLTVLGKIAVVQQENSNYKIGDRIDEIDGSLTRTVGMVGVVPDLARDFMNDENELFIRSDLLKFNGWFGEEGDPFYESDYRGNWTGELLLDENLLDEYGLSTGDTVYQINGSGLISGIYSIIGGIDTSLVGSGLTAELVGGIAMIHLGELQYAMGYHEVITPEGPRKDLSTAFYIDIIPEMRSSSEQKRIYLELEKKFPGLEVTTKENRLYRIDEEVLVLEVFAVSVAVASISIGILFLSSIMIIDVEDRRTDISIMRAIGISRRTIFLQTVKDSLILSSIGGIIGLVPGWIGASILDAYLRNLYGLDIEFASFELLVVLASFMYLFILVSIFSLVPAVRATTILPRSGLLGFMNR
jgi:ABC-type antimicrobial peptide transport system permease subunit